MGLEGGDSTGGMTVSLILDFLTFRCCSVSAYFTGCNG